MAEHRELADVEGAVGRRRLIASDFACRRFNRFSETAHRKPKALTPVGKISFLPRRRSISVSGNAVCKLPLDHTSPPLKVGFVTAIEMSSWWAILYRARGFELTATGFRELRVE